MYMVNNRVYVASGWEDEFKTRFQNRAGQIDKQDGFVRMQILEPKSENTPFVVMTTWENEQAFKNWIGSDDFKLAHANPMPKEAFSGEGQLEQFEIVISAEK
jgi:heme oxygenase (mycobilin-producing)